MTEPSAAPAPPSRRSRVFPLVLFGSIAAVVLTSLPLLVDPDYDAFYYDVVFAHWVAGLLLVPLYYFAFFRHVLSHLGRYRTVMFVVLLVPITFLGGIGPPFVSPWHNPLSLPIAILTVVLYGLLRRRERRFFKWRVPPLRLLQSINPGESRLSLWTGGAALIATWLMVHTGLALVLADFKFANDKYFLHGPISIALVPLPLLHLLARRRKYGIRLRWRGRIGLALFFTANTALFAVSLFKCLAPIEQLRPSIVERVATAPISETPAPLADDTLALVRDSAPCQACHPEVAHAWSQSSHRFAGLNTLYLKLVRKMAEEKGPDSVRFCDNCHDPVLALAADPETRFAPETLALSEGVSCKVCHFLEPEEEPAGNGVYSLLLVRGLGFPEASSELSGVGVFDPSRARLDSRLHIRGVQRRWYKSSDACRACHVIEIPAHLNGAEDVELTPLFASYEAWPGSADTSCRDCHMTNVDRDKQRYRQWDHRFAGSNQALSLLVPREHRGAALPLEAFTDAALRGDRPKRYDQDDIDSERARDLFWGGTLFPMELELEGAAGDPRRTLVVRTSNPKMGHDFPVDLQDQVDVWLELRVSDARGEPLFASGGVDDDGYLEEGTRRLGIELYDRDGEPITHHETWRLAEIRNRKFIPPGGRHAERFDLHLPADAQLPFAVEARWRFRRVNQGIADWLFEDDGTTFPITELSSVSAELS